MQADVVDLSARWNYVAKFVIVNKNSQVFICKFLILISIFPST